MPNFVALIQAQGAIRLLSVPLVDVLITVHYYLLPLGSAFSVKRLTKTGDDFFLPASSRSLRCGFALLDLVGIAGADPRRH